MIFISNNIVGKRDITRRKTSKLTSLTDRAMVDRSRHFRGIGGSACRHIKEVNSIIQVKEFIDTDSVFAEKRANEFLADLRDDQVINICYGSMMKNASFGNVYQRSTILVIYKTDKDK
jgi:hypothetical protein